MNNIKLDLLSWESNLVKTIQNNNKLDERQRTYKINTVYRACDQLKKLIDSLDDELPNDAPPAVNKSNVKKRQIKKNEKKSDFI